MRTLLARLYVALGGWVYIGHESRPGWSGSLPFYTKRCLRHGMVKNYPQGFDHTLECPNCVRERLEKIGRMSGK